MSRVIAVVNQKGGVGKTTTVANLGAALAEKGRRVLMIDLDPQGSLSSSFGLDVQPAERTLYHLLIDPSLDPHRSILRIRERLDLLPADIHLAAAELELADRPQRTHVLKGMLERLADDYDFVLIDCGPSLGLLTVNALVAAQEIIVPLLCEYLALRGIGTLFENIARVRHHLNPELRVRGVLPVMFDRRPSHTRQILAEARALFGDYMFPFEVKRSIRFAEATVAGQPMIEYAPHHPGAHVYRQLAEAIIDDQDQKG